MKAGRKLIFLWVLCMIVTIPAGGLLASRVRVDTLGYRSLIPDQEVDMNINPAYISEIDRITFYGGINSLFDNYEDTESDSINDHESRYYLLNGGIQAVFPLAQSVNIALKYSPEYSKSTFKNDFDNTTQESRDLARSSVILGFASGPDLSMGLALEFGRENMTNDDANYTSSYNNTYEVLLRAGLLFKYGSGSRLGIVLLGRYQNVNYDFHGDNDEPYSDVDRDLSSAGIMINPEFQLAGNTLLRITANLGYKYARSYITADYTSREHSGRYHDIYDNFGISLIGNLAADRFYYLSLFSYGILYSKDHYSYDLQMEPNNSTIEYEQKYHYQVVEMKIGIEQPIIDSVLKLRASISPLFAGFSRTRRTTYLNNEPDEDTSNKNLTVNGPIASFTLGVGYTPAPNVLIDLNFSYMKSIFEKGDYTTHEYNQTTTQQLYQLNAALTCSF